MLVLSATREHIRVVYLDPDGQAVTTDGHRLHVAPIVGVIPGPVAIKAAAAELLSAAIKTAGDLVSIRTGGARVEVSTGRYRVSCASEDNFPPWRQVVPKVRPFTHSEIRIDAKRLDEELKRLDSREKLCGVKIEASDGAIRVTRSAFAAENRPEISMEIPAEITATTDGADMAPIGVCVAYLRQALGPRPAGEITIAIAAPLDPLDVQQGGRHAVVMPMRI